MIVFLAAHAARAFTAVRPQYRVAGNPCCPPALRISAQTRRADNLSSGAGHLHLIDRPARVECHMLAIPL